MNDAGDSLGTDASARYRLLFEQSRDIILFVRRDGRIVDANPAAVAAYGYDRAMLTTLSIADLRDPATVGDLAELMRRADEGGVLFESWHRRRDGTTFPVEVSSLGANLGGERLLLSIVRDITARRAADAARERLHAEREALLDSAAEGIFGMDANGDCTFINPAAVRMLGFAPEEVMGRDMHGLIHHSRPDGSPYPIEACLINTAFEEGRSLHLVEEVLWRKDGTSFPAFYSVSTVVEDGVVTSGVVTIVDITARKQAEERLRLLREASDSLAASLDYDETLTAVMSLIVSRFADWCALFVCAPDGSVRRIEADYADPVKREIVREFERFSATADLSGTVGAAAVLRTGQPELYPEVPDSFWQGIAQGPEHLAALRRTGMRSLMLVPLRARGQTIGVLVVGTAESGRRFGLEDLTFAEAFAERAAVAIDNARLFREAQAAEARYRGLFNGAAESIVAYDAEGRLLDANDAVVRLLGYRRDELMAIGTGGDAFLDDAADLIPIAAELTKRGVWHGEVRLRRKDGTTVPVEANVARIDLPEGPVYLALWHDISERQAREQFEHEFLADIAHDLKNPLTVIRAQTQLLTRRLRMGRLDDEVAGTGLKEIDTGTARMVRRIDELSDVARLRLGRALELRPESTDLVALAEQLAATWRRATEGHEIRVVADVPELTGEWDAVRLERVLDNLLSNAVKYSSQSGPIEIRVTREGEAVGGWAVLTVRDEGIGVPAADLPWIFERFHRAGNVTGRVAGTGIGLAGARQIVTQHGGTIALESEEGRGTAVTVRLPLAASV